MSAQGFGLELLETILGVAKQSSFFAASCLVGRDDAIAINDQSFSHELSNLISRSLEAQFESLEVFFPH
jgi:hypothetical protein